MVDRQQGKSRERTRADRLRAALRENLKRRKAQVQGRTKVVKPHDSAGITPEIAPDKPKG